MTRTSSLEVSIKTHIDCILNISMCTIILTVLCMYITAPPVNYSILCLSSTVHIVAFVNLLLKKMVVVVVDRQRFRMQEILTVVRYVLYTYPISLTIAHNQGRVNTQNF